MHEWTHTRCRHSHHKTQEFYKIGVSTFVSIVLRQNYHIFPLLLFEKKKKTIPWCNMKVVKYSMLCIKNKFAKLYASSNHDERTIAAADWPESTLLANWNTSFNRLKYHKWVPLVIGTWFNSIKKEEVAKTVRPWYLMI